MNKFEFYYGHLSSVGVSYNGKFLCELFLFGPAFSEYPIIDADDGTKLIKVNKTMVKVSWLMLVAFKVKPELSNGEYLFVDYIDGNKKNIKSTNLRWKIVKDSRNLNKEAEPEIVRVHSKGGIR